MLERLAAWPPSSIRFAAMALKAMMLSYGSTLTAVGKTDGSQT